MSDKSNPKAIVVPLVEDEYRAFVAVAGLAKLEPPELLWACVDSLMDSADDGDVLAGCHEAADQRFRGYILSGWAEEL